MNLILNRLKWPVLFLFLVIPAFGSVPEKMFPEINGWQLTIERDVYTPDNLWDLIDGAAEVYLSYNFQDLNIAEYTNNQNQTVRVELYRLSSPVNAFGIYATERMTDYNFVKIGVQGYTSEGALDFFTGDFYVKIMTTGSEKLSADILENIAKNVDNYLSAGNKWPAELSVFPDKGKIKNGEGYIAENFLGYSFLRSAFTAEYTGTKSKLFIIHFPNEDQAKETLKKYFDQIKDPTREVSDKNYTLNDPYNGKIYVGLASNYLLGVINADDQNTAFSYIDTMRERLPGK